MSRIDSRVSPLLLFENREDLFCSASCEISLAGTGSSHNRSAGPRCRCRSGPCCTSATFRGRCWRFNSGRSAAWGTISENLMQVTGTAPTSSEQLQSRQFFGQGDRVDIVPASPFAAHHAAARAARKSVESAVVGRSGWTSETRPLRRPRRCREQHAAEHRCGSRVEILRRQPGSRNLRQWPSTSLPCAIPAQAARHRFAHEPFSVLLAVLGGTGGSSASVSLENARKQHWRASRQCHPIPVVSRN